MTVEEAALLRAITAAPGDHTVRLAYADWLDEHGRSIEAAWVREEDFRPPRVTRFQGDGNNGRGSGGGSGYSHGKGHGRGRADGEGYSDGHGSGYGEGSGDGDDGSDVPSNRRHGSGYGSGRGNADAQGRGNGDAYGRGGHGNPDKPHITHEEVHVPAPGEYVIVRSRDQGCMCGEYRNHHGREVVLDKARQIVSWDERRQTLIDFGVVPDSCRLSREAPGEVVMLEACGIIPTTPDVEAFLRAHPGE